MLIETMGNIYLCTAFKRHISIYIINLETVFPRKKKHKKYSANNSARNFLFLIIFQINK